MKTVEEYMAMLTEPLSAEVVREVIRQILLDAEEAIEEAWGDGIEQGREDA